MSHQNLKGWLEDYAENSLSAEMTQDLEQHLAMCRDCQEQLRTIRLTANVLRASRLDKGPVPAAGFARSVFLTIEQQRENYFFWSPLRLMALKAVPVMAVLAVALGFFAYTEMSSDLSAQQLTEEPLLETSLELSSKWGQEAAVFSEQISQDKEQVVSTLLEAETLPQEQGKESK
ncbi:MAG TPA: zf-HC2 domain-containing protein [Terriglobia bacterium]|nr:zf-HC2 domain-containing protein [Terriglobia bacterium]